MGGSNLRLGQAFEYRGSSSPPLPAPGCLHSKHCFHESDKNNLHDTFITHYARRLWISVMAGTCLAFENGFHLLIKSHHPEIVSPKLRGELSSIYGRKINFHLCKSQG